MTAEWIVFNGVHGATGRYLRPPIRRDRLARRFRPAGRSEPPAPVTAPIAGVDPRDLGESGWAVVFAPDVPREVRAALAPLLEHRRRQASRDNERLYRECSLLPGETLAGWQRRHAVGPGPADPAKLPYYLLIVASPRQVPWLFQHQIDVQRAVGRIGFETPEEYARYAESVVAAETRPISKPRQAAVFAPQHPGDRLSGASVEELARPLAGRLERAFAPGPTGWTVRREIGAAATKARLGDLLGGDGTPALLFTAGHGIGLDEDDPRLIDMQGALLCGDWPGPAADHIAPGHFFAACDLPAAARLDGLVAFFFACYSAGTPEWDSFFPKIRGRSRRLAPVPFSARLPERMLAQGALAVIGHVDMTWPCSFLWEETGAQVQVFESTLTQLMAGYPVGAAMEFFGQRYAELAARLSARLEPGGSPPDPDEPDLSALWLACLDARSYALCGDPAVRLTAPSGAAL